MYERTRRAIIVTGERVDLVERGSFAADDHPGIAEPATLFTQDGQRLIDEGDGFFRNPFGGQYKLVD